MFCLICDAHGPTSALHSKFLCQGSQRVGVSSNQKTDLGYSAFIRLDGSVVLIVLNRYRNCVLMYLWDLGFQVLICFYCAGHHLWSGLRSGTPLWATSLPPLRLIHCSHLLGKHTDCWPLCSRLTFLTIKAANIFKYDANGVFMICCLNF